MASSFTLQGTRISGQSVNTFGIGNLGTYSSNGIAVTPQQVGLGAIDDLQVSPAGGYLFTYDKTNGKVLAYQSDDAVDPLDEVGSTDISAAIFRWRAYGA